MSEKHKKVYRALNYFEHFHIFVSAVSGFVSISSFTSLGGAPASITSSTVGLKIYALAAGIKKYVNKKRKKHDNIVLLAKTKLNAIFLKS